MNKKLKGLVLGVAIATISSGIYGVKVFAATKTLDESKATIQWRKDFKKPTGDKKIFVGKNTEEMKTFLNELVREGKLSQEKVNNIISYIEKKSEERKAEMEKIKNMTPEERKAEMEKKKVAKEERISPFDALVKDGVITESELTSIQNKLHEKMTTERNARIKEQFKSLVDNKTITEDQVNKLIEKMNKINEMKRDMFKQMVDEGIITSDQAEAMKKAIHGDKKVKIKEFKKEVKQENKTNNQ